MQSESGKAETIRGVRPIRVFRNGTRQAVAGALAMCLLPVSFSTALGQAQGQYPSQGQEQGAPPPPPDYDNGSSGDGNYGNQNYGNLNYGNPGPSNYQPLAPEQIDQLVAPIALYPDSLVAQVLAAATYPAQVASAEQFVQQSGNYPPEQLAEAANTQPWDPSVKSLVAFPQVLNDLDRNMDWTTQLGNAYFNQPQDVLGAVQIMRQRAYAAGNLRTGPQLAVTYAPGDILIEPVSPSVVYVPYYNPWVIYGAPIPVYRGYYYGAPRGVVFGSGLAIGFGVGLAVGAFTHFSWGYHNWAPDWRSRAVVYNHNTYISRSVTVVNHGDYGHFDRAPQARAYNQQQAARYGGGNRTINNVPINRGGNTFNNGGNTVNRPANTYNRGGNTFNNGGNTLNRGGQTYNTGGSAYGGNAYNRGGTVGNPASAYNRGNYQANPQANNGQFNRGNGGVQGNAAARPGGGFDGRGGGPARPEGNFGAQANAPRPQGNFNRGGGSPQPNVQPQQHSAPPQQTHGGGGGEQHGGGGGHDEHGGGGHDHH
jgi:hypothetical protein